MISRAWAERDKLILRLPPKRLPLEPGTSVTVPVGAGEWVVHEIMIEGYVVVATLHPSASATGSLACDPGRVANNPDLVAGPLTLALLDVPTSVGGQVSGPIVLLAASSAGAGWQPAAVEISFAGQDIATQTARGKALLGHAATLLPADATDLMDEQSVVEVDLLDQGQWLTSCDRDGLAAGQNLAILGNELVQFAQATSLGQGRFRLSQLLRGRGGTEWACGGHTIGELFCMLDSATLQPVALPSWSIGATLQATASTGATCSSVFAGDGVRPLSPVNLSVQLQATGDLSLSWTRRSRLGFAWLDAIDAPLGESSEQYRVTLMRAVTSIELTSNSPGMTVAAGTLASLGSGPVTIEVRQIGDCGASRPAQTTLNLS